MAKASPRSVADRSAFQNRTYREGNDDFRFYTRAQRLFVEITKAGNPPQHLPILYTFGVSPLQQYLVPIAGGKLQALTVAWDVGAKRWYSVRENTATGEASRSLHWNGRYQNWNAMCAECHATAVRKGYSARTDSYKTTWIAPNVGCQACHGPGAAHAREAAKGKPGAIIRYRTLSAAQSVDHCGTCHSRRASIGQQTELHPSFQLFDQYQPETLRERLFHADGQQLGEVFEYASFRQSRMYGAGVGCTDCHDSHTGKTRQTGNTLCTQCHSTAGAPRFPALQAKNYDTPAHHLHANGTPAAQCVTCHMPTRTYMGIHERRDHSIRVPRPDLTTQIGVPNACTNACHQERDAVWAAQQIRQHGGSRANQPHYGEAIAAARRGASTALPALQDLVRSSETPAIVKATVIEELGRYGAAIETDMAADLDPAVRLATAEAGRQIVNPQTLPSLRPLLFDSAKAVRLGTARRLAGLPDDVLTSTEKTQLADSLTEYRSAQASMADFSAAWLNLAGLDLQLNNSQAAESHLAQALTRDPELSVARIELARLQVRYGKIDEAEHTLRNGLRLNPADPELLLSLALIRAQQGALEEATTLLENAYKIAPDHPRIKSNLLALLHKLGRNANAITNH
jgi:predicted CXXCH cytochrome family protein